MFRTFYRVLPAATFVAMAASFAAPARATEVTYSTAGSFSCGSIAVGCSVYATNTAGDSIAVTSGGKTETLTFYNNTGTTLGPLPPAQTTNFGDIQACNQSPDGCTAGNMTPVSFAGATFSLQILQTEPPPPGGSSNTLTGTLSGSIASQGGTAAVSFSPSVLTLGAVTYTLDYNGVFQIPAPSSCGANGLCGDEILTGNVNSTAPEPALLGATGLGLVGLLGMRLRRRRNQQVS